MKQEHILIENYPPQVRNFYFAKDITGWKFGEIQRTEIFPNCGEGEDHSGYFILFQKSLHFAALVE